ncbi:MAG TPA: glycogen synthase GlgA [Desulfuromonadales bacterium]|nr:glycogen synthase GlgA [Desulfuromonadales bacterium]
MSDRSLNILMVASEAAPFAKTGGLADVVGALPPALQARGHDVRVVLPGYRCVRQSGAPLRRSRAKIPVPVGGRLYPAGYREGRLDEVPVYFIEAPELFDRDGLYGEQGQDYPDNALRFGLLSRAALELARRLDFKPDIVHAHDWQTGLVPVYLHQHLWRDPHFINTGSLFSIHNLGYQGLFAAESLTELGLDSALFDIDRLEYHGMISLLKGGIRYADRVNTVSPTYCREIQTPEFGMGFEGLLTSRRNRLHGILNGLDAALWNPQGDPALPQRYSADNPQGKQVCKQALQEELGLQPDPAIPIVAMVTRLDPQKGIDLLIENWQDLLARKLQLVILGSGTPRYERQLDELARTCPGRSKVLKGFNDPLARRIYAGSDLFLMPSRYEPCGLGQLIALRYGSVPVVRATGGLADTISDPQDAAEEANGFLFAEDSASALLQALDRALSAYDRPPFWRKLVERGMHQDFSWQGAAAAYVALYRRINDDRSG